MPSAHPGSRTLLPHLGPLGFVFRKPIKYITKGGFAPWRRKYDEFAEAGMDIISSVCLDWSCPTSTKSPCDSRSGTDYHTSNGRHLVRYRGPGYFEGVWRETLAQIRKLTGLQELTAHRLLFPKPVQLYRVLTFFGPNVVASEFDEWKRYRKITAPAFSEVSRSLLLLHRLRLHRKSAS